MNLWSIGKLPILASTVVLLVASISGPPLHGEGRSPGGDATLLLDPSGLADNVNPGEILATLQHGTVALFSFDELKQPDLENRYSADGLRIDLWRTDGTPEGTWPLLPAELSFVYSYGVFRENLYFSVCRPSRPLDPRNGYRCEFPGDAELWRTDGTPEGTRPILPGNDLHPWIYGPGFPVAMVPEMGRVFFEVFDDTDEDELWVTDGTSQGTRMLKRLSDLGLESLAGLEDFGGTLYSLAGKGAGQERRFWVVRSDGTPGGTVAFPAGLGGLPYVVSWEVIGDSWFVFAGTSGRDVDPETGQKYRLRSLWVLDRGDEEFRRLGSLGRGDIFDTVRYPTGRQEEGPLFFDIPEYPSYTPQVWASDATVSGTHPIAHYDHYYGPSPVSTGSLSLEGGLALGAFETPDLGNEPWSAGVDPEKTRLLADLCPGECSSEPAGLAALDGWFYFTAQDLAHGRELWRWQPATQRIELVGDLSPGPTGSNPVLVDQTPDRFYVRALDADHRQHIWQIVAGRDGVQEVGGFNDLRLGAYRLISGRGVYPWKVVGDRSLFWTSDDHDHVELWSRKLPSDVTLPPPGEAIVSDELPGFAVKVRISAASSDPILGHEEEECIPETVCISGAVEGRSEVFVRVVGPKPNGYLWPTIVKFTTSTVDVWIEQLATGIVRHYHLDGASRESSELPGLFDRGGFLPAS